jgi:hypothetical protein
MELKDALSQTSVYGSKDGLESKKIMEEIQKLRSLNKHRDEIITQMDA